MSLQTFRDRWSLFVGTFLAVTLGVGLVVSSVLILLAASRYGKENPADAFQAEEIIAFVAIVLSVGAFLSAFIISSTFAFAVQERRRDLALLRICGANRTQVRMLLHAEGLLVGLFGTVAGLGVGAQLARLELVFIGRIGLPVDALELQMSSAVVLWSLLGGLVTSILGVAVPARRASKVKPLEALTNLGSAARVMTISRWFWGLAFAVATVASLGMMRALVGSSPDGAIALTLLVVFTGAICLQQLSPLLVPAIAKATGLLVKPWVEADVAASNLIDATRRTATVAGPLIALTGIVVGLFGVLQTLSAAEGADRLRSTSADLVIETDGPVPDDIDRVSGVAASTSLTWLTGTISELPDLEGDPRTIVVVDPASYPTLMNTPFSPGAAEALSDSTAIIGEDPDGDLRNREAITVNLSGRTIELAVVGHVEGFMLADLFTVMVPRSAIPTEQLSAAPTRTLVAVADNVPVFQVRENLAQAGFEASPVAEWSAAYVEAGQRESNVVMVGLAGIGAVAALLAVINALALSAAARKREFAVDQVIGMSRAQVIRSSVLESVMVCVLGILLGGVATAVLLVGLRDTLDGILGEPVLVTPWSAAGLVTAVSLVAVSATAAIATTVATRPRPISLAADRE